MSTTSLKEHPVKLLKYAVRCGPRDRKLQAELVRQDCQVVRSHPVLRANAASVVTANSLPSDGVTLSAALSLTSLTAILEQLFAPFSATDEVVDTFRVAKVQWPKLGKGGRHSKTVRNVASR